MTQVIPANQEELKQKYPLWENPEYQTPKQVIIGSFVATVSKFSLWIDEDGATNFTPDSVEALR